MKVSCSTTQQVQSCCTALRLAIEASQLEFLWTRLDIRTLEAILFALEDVLASMETREALCERFHSFSSDNGILKHTPVAQWLREALMLQKDQTTSICAALRSAIKGPKVLVDEESQDKSTQHLSDRSQQLQESRQSLDPHILFNTEKSERFHALLDTSCLIALELQKVVLLSLRMRASSTRRRRIHWPYACLRFRQDKFQSANHEIQSEDWEIYKPTLWQYIRYAFAHGITQFRDSRHTQYAFKFQLVMAMLAIWPFISDWRIWYSDVRGHWAMVFAMVVMEIARGFVFRSAIMKITGSVCGGLLAGAVYSIGGTMGEQVRIPAMTILTFLCMLGIFNVALNPRFGKAGLVAALAYNLVLGIGYSTTDPWLAFAKRTATQFVGILVACVVTVMVFPYHARRELKNEIRAVLDDVAQSFYSFTNDSAIDSDLKERIRKRLGYARELLRYTKFEPSLKGRFPRETFSDIVEGIGTLISLHSNQQRLQEHEIVLLDNHMSDGYQAYAKDIYLMSHSISTRSKLVCSLATNSGSTMSKIPIEFNSKAGTYSSMRMINIVLDRLRRKVGQAVDGRTFAGQLQHASLPKNTPLMAPNMSCATSHRGSVSLAAPTQAFALPVAILSPAILNTHTRRGSRVSQISLPLSGKY